MGEVLDLSLCDMRRRIQIFRIEFPSIGIEFVPSFANFRSGPPDRCPNRKIFPSGDNARSNSFSGRLTFMANLFCCFSSDGFVPQNEFVGTKESLEF